MVVYLCRHEWCKEYTAYSNVKLMLDEIEFVEGEFLLKSRSAIYSQLKTKCKVILEVENPNETTNKYIVVKLKVKSGALGKSSE